MQQNLNSMLGIADSLAHLPPLATNNFEQIVRTIDLFVPKWTYQLTDIIHAVDFSALGFSAFADTIGNLADIDYSNFKEADFSTINGEMIEEFKQDIASIDIQNENLEIQLNGGIVKWSKIHPLLERIFKEIKLIIVQILIGLVVNTIITQVENLSTKSDAAIKEEPKANSSIVMVIPEGSTVYVVDEIPYWVKIQYIQPDSENINIGWVSKRSLREIEEIPLGYSE
jgi:hypothetical protein